MKKSYFKVVQHLKEGQQVSGVKRMLAKVEGEGEGEGEDEDEDEDEDEGGGRGGGESSTVNLKEQASLLHGNACISCTLYIFQRCINYV